MYSNKNKQIVINRLKSLGIEIIKDNGHYAIVECPSCQKPRAFVAYERGKFARIKCNRSGSCNYSKLIYNETEAEEYKTKKKEEAEYFKEHGLNYSGLVDCGIIGTDCSIALKKGVYKRFCKRGKKYGWLSPKKEFFSKEDGDFYPAINEFKDIEEAKNIKTLYVFEGEADWLKAFQDGICSSAPIFGAKTIPAHDQTIAMFTRFENIFFCYDSDEAGTKYASIRAMNLAKIFPKKKIGYIILPFEKEDKGKDYCDWRKKRTLEEFLDLEPSIVDIEKTKKQKKIEKKIEKIKQQLGNQEIEIGETVKTFSCSEEVIWHITKNAVWKFSPVKIEGIETGLVEKKKIIPQSVLIEDICADIIEDDTYVELSVNGKKMKTNFGMDDLMFTSKINILTKKGIKINENSKKDAVLFFSEYIEDMKYKPMSFRNGWLDRNSFILGDKIVFKDRIETIRFTGKAYIPGTNGSKEKLDEIYREFLDDTQVSLAMAVATTSPLLYILGVPSFTFHIFSSSSEGKSFIALLALSLFGKASSNMKMWNQTNVGFETYLEEANGLPSMLDDSQEAEEEIVSKTIYIFGNQKGKGRGTVIGSKVRRGEEKEWNGLMFSTGESKASGIKGGAQARLMEMYRKPQIVSSDMAQKVFATKNKMSENYGWYGLEIIRYILEEKKELKKIYNHYIEELSEKFKDKNTLNLRLLPYCSAILTGAYILQKLKAPICSSALIEDELLKCITREEIKTTEEKCIEHIESVTNSNMNKFFYKAEHLEEKPYNEIWGKITEDKEYRIVHFLPFALSEILKKGGFNISIMSILNQKGMLITNKGNQNTVRLERGGKPARVYSIKIPNREQESVTPSYTDVTPMLHHQYNY